MRMLFTLIILAPLFFYGQAKKTYKIRSIAFYNVENLFDTTNDSLTIDDERTPNGTYNWTAKRYDKKIAHISKVISSIGKEVTGTSPDIVGLCEIEKRNVLTQLINHKNLLNYYSKMEFNSLLKRERT